MDDGWVRDTEGRLHGLEMKGAVDEVNRAAVERRLSAIEDMLKWLVRLVFGALILGVVGFAMQGGLGALTP